MTPHLTLIFSFSFLSTKFFFLKTIYFIRVVDFFIVFIENQFKTLTINSHLYFFYKDKK